MANPSNNQSMPGFDRALTTRNFCAIGLGVSLVLSVASVATGAWQIRQKHGPDNDGLGTISVPEAVERVAPYLLTAAVTLCTESLGYIQSVSLRWALIHEGRADFNSSLRLFTGSRTSMANGWQANALSAIVLVTCYTSAGQLLSPAQEEGEMYLNSVALLILGLSLLVMSILATCAMVIGRTFIQTWSANPLNTTMACIHIHTLQRQPDRAFLSVHDLSRDAGPALARSSQASLIKATKRVKRVMKFFYVVVFLCFVLTALSFVLVVTLSKREDHDWRFFASGNGFGSGSVLIVGGPEWPDQLRLFCLLAFCAAIQSFITLALHTLELLVNMSRDEDIWREASSSRGSRTSTNPFLSALTNWPWLVLFLLKPFSQWVFGLGVLVQIGQSQSEVSFKPIPLCILSGVAVFLLLFIETLIRYRRKGPQPAAYGHLQTIANLIDDWGQENQPLWWGSKSSGTSTLGKVGTSSKREVVGVVHPNRLYT